MNIKNPEILWNTLHIAMETYCVSCKKNTAKENSNGKKSNKIY